MNRLIYSKEYPRDDWKALEKMVDSFRRQETILTELSVLPDFDAIRREMESRYAPDSQRIQEAEGFLTLAKELAEERKIDIAIYEQYLSYGICLLFDSGTDLTPFKPLLNMADEFVLCTMLEDSDREMMMIIEYRMYVRQK